MLIALIGQDGAGKSTQTALLKDWLIGLGKEVYVLDKWDVYDSEMYPECRFLAGDHKLLRVCIAEMDGPARALFLAWTMETTLKQLKRSNPNAVYIADGYWIKHAASEIVYGAPSHWIENLFSVFPKPDVTFYFEVQPELAAARKEDFTPYECGRDNTINIESFLKHQHRVAEIMSAWKAKNEWVSIETKEPPERTLKLLQLSITKAMQELETL